MYLDWVPLKGFEGSCRGSIGMFGLPLRDYEDYRDAGILWSSPLQQRYLTMGHWSNNKPFGAFARGEEPSNISALRTVDSLGIKP